MQSSGKSDFQELNGFLSPILVNGLNSLDEETLHFYTVQIIAYGKELERIIETEQMKLAEIENFEIPLIENGLEANPS